jgi:oxygen-independent coproporphyrinogen-3 oxidase
MLRLRLREGIDVRSYEETFGRDFNSDFPTLDKYISNGFMYRDGDRVAFTDRGFLVSNTILSDIL